MSHRFTQIDVQRAVKGARAAGLEPTEVRVTSEGDIRIIVAERAGSAATPQHVLDEIERHFGARR